MFSYSSQLYRDLVALKQLATKVGWKSAVRCICRPDASPSWQFTKYLIIGGTAVLIFYGAYGVFRILVELLSPGAFTHQRMLWNLLAIFFAFIPTNSFTYHTNRRWVFVDGKHSQQKEFILFTSGAALSLVSCQLVTVLLIRYSSVNDLMVTLSVIVISTVVNFLFRKFCVFRG
jgi:putative flippase GtrA